MDSGSNPKCGRRVFLQNQFLHTAQIGQQRDTFPVTPEVYFPKSDWKISQKKAFGIPSKWISKRGQSKRKEHRVRRPLRHCDLDWRTSLKRDLCIAITFWNKWKQCKVSFLWNTLITEYKPSWNLCQQMTCSWFSNMVEPQLVWVFTHKHLQQQ